MPAVRPDAVVALVGPFRGSAPDTSTVPGRGPTHRRVTDVPYRAEYIWIDGTEPVPNMRSKTKVIEDGKEPGLWGFDGSSTNQAEGSASDCVLKPVFTCKDPLRGPDDI